MNKRITAIFLSFLVLLLLLTGQAFSQGTTSRLTGTIVDNAGAVVLGATVTWINCRHLKRCDKESQR